MINVHTEQSFWKQVQSIFFSPSHKLYTVSILWVSSIREREREKKKTLNVDFFEEQSLAIYLARKKNFKISWKWKRAIFEFKFFKLKLIFFRSTVKFGKYKNFSYNSIFSYYQHHPPEWYIYYNWWTYIDTSLSQKVHRLCQSSLLVLHIPCIWTNIMISLHHYSIRQTSFTTLKILCSPPIHPSPSFQPLVTPIFLLSL